MRPTWQDLPDDFKSEMVQYLDLRSRFNISICSKTDQKLVRNSLLLIPLVELQIENATRIYIKLTLYISENCENSKSGRKYNSYWYGYLKNNAVGAFVSLLKHFCQLRIESFEVIAQNNNHSFINKLQTQIQSFDEHFQLKVERFLWRAWNDSSIECLWFMKMLKPKHLKYIALTLEIAVRSRNFEGITETDQWKFAEKLETNYEMEDEENFKIESYLHARKIYLNNSCYSVNDVWTVIQTFRSIDLPVGSCSAIKTEGVTKEHLFTLFDVPLHNNPIPHNLEVKLPYSEFETIFEEEGDLEWTQRFSTVNSDCVFVVEFRKVYNGATKISGQIMSRGNGNGNERWTSIRCFQTKNSYLKYSEDFDPNHFL